MEEPQNLESSNINTLWLQNIYENLKNLETMERLAREGCNNILEYVQIPIDRRNIIIGDVQYKNLRFIITDLILILPSLQPVVDKDKFDKFSQDLTKLRNIIPRRQLLIKETFNANREIIDSNVTELFWQYLECLSIMRSDLISSIGKLLFIHYERPF